MYFIQSNKDDHSTNDVLDWLFYLEKESIINRFNNETSIRAISFSISNAEGLSTKISTDKGALDAKEIKHFWYRRGGFNWNTSFTFPSEDITLKNLVFKIQNNFQNENEKMTDVLYSSFEKNKRINNFRENFTNKIHNLSEAHYAGLKIPETLITNNMDELVEFSSRYDSIITKDIEFNTFHFTYQENQEVYIHQPVVKLSKKEIQDQSSKTAEREFQHFSMYQQYTEKKYELRIFYLRGRFYTMAIFSQANEKTKTDFRNYDTERPNRCIPYQLPQDIEEKLNLFMQNINLNCGSIDMIYTPEKEYVFLEVNPIGQFQWLSKSCNYDIERQIAMNLLNEKT
ncbi:grasp-with-spasm system ATP-grasp peptide maturase [Chryseobacterium phosphatilyticum]|uniref:Grasp-with-spasm system ATP-grasp peptide maturase n=1 Tax=Chryseobacterium phosphatilyticum TaxID=475075 RepID=A0A316XLR7_9FLAO|nr:grasp-with-spasm system ATP-grasp peptide maturase [Chryseobacterium phosphatilyticum]PWN71850.1 grasp-with-spasm system ATP-grasp peptide maturase [Chryseobacterium phosphatilyticum]